MPNTDRCASTSDRSARVIIASPIYLSEIDWRFPITVRRLVVSGRYVHLGWRQRPGANDYPQYVSQINTNLIH